MIEIIHCADLHLSPGEQAYGLAVLDEIVRLARERRAAFLLFAGDTFDSFPAAEALRAEFRQRIRALSPACEVLLLTGNHEELQRGRGSLRSLDLGPVTLLDQKPFAFLRREGCEFLAVPHGEHVAGYRDWMLPPKEGPRIVLAHGVVAGLTFGGVDPEAGGSALDPDLFTRCRADYAALGHVHARRQESRDGMTLAYPGSARVWRRGEAGERGVLRLGLPEEPGRPPAIRFHPLTSAGEYREVPLLLDLDGCSEDPALGSEAWGAKDWVRVTLSGLVEDEHSAGELAADLERRWGSRVRRLEIDRGQVSALPGIASHPLARAFLAVWKEREPPGEEERPVWLRARQLGLLAIKEALEARR